MSQPSLGNPSGVEVPAQKQRLNVYTVMLIISFICIITATILLYVELERWGSFPWWNTQDARPAGVWLDQSPVHGLTAPRDIA